MANRLLVGDALPNIPWQPRPSGTSDVVWRSSQNPVIPRHASPTADSIYNSAVVPFRGAFAGVFRCDDRARNMTLRVGRSADGVRFEISDERLRFECDIPEIAEFLEGYDPRVVPLDPATSRLAIYYGAADTSTGLAFCEADELLAYLKDNSEL